MGKLNKQSRQRYSLLKVEFESPKVWCIHITYILYAYYYYHYCFHYHYYYKYFVLIYFRILSSPWRGSFLKKGLLSGSYFPHQKKDAGDLICRGTLADPNWMDLGLMDLDLSPNSFDNFDFFLWWLNSGETSQLPRKKPISDESFLSSV